MQGHHTRLLLALGCALLVMGLAGCFQTAGDPAGGIGVAGISTFTPTPEEALAPVVTATPSPEFLPPLDNTPTPEIEVAQVPTATPTIEPEPVEELPLFVTATPTIEPEPVEELPLFVTATPTMMLFFEDTPTPLDQAASLGDGSQPQQDLLSDAALTATAVLERATQAYWATQTATAQVFFPTPTVENGGGGGDFFFPTATQPAVEPLPPVASGTCTHTVVRGDNLFRIALRYGSTVEAIAAANGITNISLIRVGQVLTVPNCTTGGGAGVVPPSGGGVGRPYTVRTGDTLFRLAIANNTTVEAIAANNPAITNINLIFIGQVIYIP
ncbi:MAG: LysM peptidoglycan-binding domain-containing protein [Aggregatilineales bacterium]